MLFDNYKNLKYIFSFFRFSDENNMNFNFEKLVIN